MSSRLVDILEEVGNTPLLPIASIFDKEKTIYVKLENKNPSGTIKDRLAKHIILQNPNSTGFVDTSVGNFAVSMSWFASLADKKAYFFLYEGADYEIIKRIRDFGGDLIYVNTDDFDRLANQAKIYAEERGFLYCAQFKENKFDEFYRNDISNEIMSQLPCVDKIIVRKGTGGLLSGMQLAFKKNPNINLYEAVGAGETIKRSIKPKIDLEKIEVEFDLVREVQKYLLQKCGIKAGNIGSLNTAAAMKLAEKMKKMLKYLHLFLINLINMLRSCLAKA